MSSILRGVISCPCAAPAAREIDSFICSQGPGICVCKCTCVYPGYAPVNVLVCINVTCNTCVNLRADTGLNFVSVSARPVLVGQGVPRAVARCPPGEQGVSGFGFRVSGLGFRVSDSGHQGPAKVIDAALQHAINAARAELDPARLYVRVQSESRTLNPKP